MLAFLASGQVVACKNALKGEFQELERALEVFMSTPGGYYSGCCSSNVIRLFKDNPLFKKLDLEALDLEQAKLVVVLDHTKRLNSRMGGSVVLFNQYPEKTPNYFHHSFLFYKGKILDPDMIGKGLHDLKPYLEKQFGWAHRGGKWKNLSAQNQNSVVRVFDMTYIQREITIGKNDKNTEHLIDELSLPNKNSPDYHWSEAAQILSSSH